MQQLIETFRNKRINSSSLTRGDLPKVEFELPAVILRIILSIFIFIFSIVFLVIFKLFVLMLLFPALIGIWCYLLYWGTEMNFYSGSEVANTFWFLILVFFIITCFSLCLPGFLLLVTSITLGVMLSCLAYFSNHTFASWGSYHLPQFWIQFVSRMSRLFFMRPA